MFKFCKIWLVSLLASMLLLSSCTYFEPYVLDFYSWVGLKEDNLVEELAEEVVEHYSGVQVDLTPSTPED